MNQRQREILRASACHGWYVDDDNILDVADLIKRGLARAVSDYEHIGVHATEKGEKTALRLKLISRGEYGRYQHGEAEP